METYVLATDNSCVWLIMVLISLLLTILILPPASTSFVVLIPISLTSPRQESIITISPTWNSPSKTMKIPAKISAIKDWAPRPMIRVKTPALANIVVVFAPHASRTKNIAHKKMTHFKKETINLAMVTAFLPWNATLAK